MRRYIHISAIVPHNDPDFASAMRGFFTQDDKPFIINGIPWSLEEIGEGMNMETSSWEFDITLMNSDGPGEKEGGQ